MISICIPTYEQRGYGAIMLTQLLNSILSQKIYNEYEIIISDNSKDDEIERLCKKYKLPISYYRNPITGVSENTNNAISLSKYDKIKLMYQDDKFNDRQAIDLFCIALDLNNWVVSHARNIDNNNVYRGQSKPKFIPGYFDKNTIGMPSVIAFNKQGLTKLFDTRLRTFCDLYFYHHLYEVYGQPKIIETPLVCQRFWKGSQSRNQPAYHEYDKQIILDDLGNSIQRLRP